MSELPPSRIVTQIFQLYLVFKHNVCVRRHTYMRTAPTARVASAPFPLRASTARQSSAERVLSVTLRLARPLAPKNQGDKR